MSHRFLALLRNQEMSKSIVCINIRKTIGGLKINQSHFIFSVFVQVDWGVKIVFIFVELSETTKLSWIFWFSVLNDFFKKSAFISTLLSFYNKKSSKPLLYSPLFFSEDKYQLPQRCEILTMRICTIVWIGLFAYLDWRVRKNIPLVLWKYANEISHFAGFYHNPDYVFRLFRLCFCISRFQKEFFSNSDSEISLSKLLTPKF